MPVKLQASTPEHLHRARLPRVNRITVTKQHSRPLAPRRHPVAKIHHCKVDTRLGITSLDLGSLPNHTRVWFSKAHGTPWRWRVAANSSFRVHRSIACLKCLVVVLAPRRPRETLGQPPGVSRGSNNVGSMPCLRPRCAQRLQHATARSPAARGRPQEAANLWIRHISMHRIN